MLLINHAGILSELLFLLAVLSNLQTFWGDFTLSIFLFTNPYFFASLFLPPPQNVIVLALLGAFPLNRCFI